MSNNKFAAFAQVKPFISSYEARQVLKLHGQRLDHFMSDEEHRTKMQEQRPGEARSNWNSINTRDLLSYIGIRLGDDK